MNKKEFEFILKAGEGYFVEFKESIDKTLAKEIVAFSNSQGGKIFAGISDNGQVKGIKITNKLKSLVFDIARNCDPPVLVNVSSYENKILMDTTLNLNNKKHILPYDVNGDSLDDIICIDVFGEKTTYINKDNFKFEKEIK